MAALGDLTAERPLADQEIRLIRLKPSREAVNPGLLGDGEHLECTIEYHLLAEAPPYAALSYRWGDPEDRLPLIIDGKACGIGANAVKALPQLQPPQDKDDGVHHFWVDQICINQEDTAEKSRQVSLMGQIYSRADRVVAWLGLPGDEDVDFAIDHMLRVANLLRAGDIVSALQLHHDEALLRRAAQGFRAFCDRTYWRRLWIVQEFAMARTIFIACGHAQLEYADLRDALLFLYNRPGGVADDYQNDAAVQQMPGYMKTRLEMMRAFRTSANSFLDGVLSRRRRYHLRLMHATQQPSSAIINRPLADWEQNLVRQREPLLRVLVVTLVMEVDLNQPEASEPLDRIFSVMHFADDKAEFVGFPDYKRTCKEVYQDAARRMLMQGHIDVLCYCQWPAEKKAAPETQPAHGRGKEETVPEEEEPPLATWAPDWRKGIKRSTINIWLDNTFCASGDTLKDQVMSSPDPDTVTLRGVMVDRITQVGGAWDPDWLAKLDCRAAKAYFDEVRSLCAASPRYEQGDGNEITDVEVIRTAIADRYSYREAERHPELLEGYKTAVEYMEAYISDGTDPHSVYGMVMEDELGWDAPWVTFCLKNLHSRRPFLSDTGYVGLAPMGALPGDHIVIFLGGRAAYAIRRVVAGSKDAESKDVAETWVLVGECYVHGIMYGEFMAGAPEIREFTLR